MAWRPHSHVSVDNDAPRAAAVCDRCGSWYKHNELKWQYEWFGTALTNTRFLVCYRCLDKPFIQHKVLVLPADPIPILNPRTEPFQQDEAQGPDVTNWDEFGGLWDNDQTDWDMP